MIDKILVTIYAISYLIFLGLVSYFITPWILLMLFVYIPEVKFKKSKSETKKVK